MPSYKIKCEVVAIIENRFNCCTLGETFTIGPRTPDGMCAKAFAAIYPTALAMRFSDKIAWQGDNDYIDVTCPDRDVVYRLTRIID